MRDRTSNAIDGDEGGKQVGCERLKECTPREKWKTCLRLSAREATKCAWQRWCLWLVDYL